MNLRRVVLLTLSLSLAALLPACGAPQQGRVPTDNQLTKFHPPDKEDLVSSGNDSDSGWDSLDSKPAKHAGAKPSAAAAHAGATATPAKASATKSAKPGKTPAHAAAGN